LKYLISEYKEIKMKRRVTEKETRRKEKKERRKERQKGTSNSSGGRQKERAMKKKIGHHFKYMKRNYLFTVRFFCKLGITWQMTLLSPPFSYLTMLNIEGLGFAT
jgi:hypothetical protein